MWDIPTDLYQFIFVPKHDNITDIQVKLDQV